MALILDTNALSALADGDLRLRSALGDESELAVPAAVLGEYVFGIQQSRYRDRRERWLSQFLRHAIFLPVTEPTAWRYAEIRAELKAQGRPIPSNDLWIAATARDHGWPLVTRDAHFDWVRGLRRIAW